MRPHRRQPTRRRRPWDSPGKNTGVSCHFLPNAWKWKVKEKSLSRVQPSATPWTAAYQAPPSMGFSRQEYWSGLPLPSPIILLGMSKYSHTFAIYFWTTLLLFKLNSNVNQIGQIFYFILKNSIFGCLFSSNHWSCKCFADRLHDYIFAS